MLSSRDSEILLRSGAAPGRLGAPTGAPLFLASSRSRSQLREEADAPRSLRDPEPCPEAHGDAVRQPMLVLDVERKVRLRNPGAEELLARGDLLHEHRGILACRDHDSDRRLGLAIGRLWTACERQAVWLRGRDHPGAAAMLHLLQAAEGGERRHAMVMVAVFEPGKAPRVDPHLIAMAYRLTATEARLASLVASGKGTAHCAEALGVKTSTLRSHLASIYRKTGAKGQSDLVRIVLCLCAI